LAVTIQHFLPSGPAAAANVTRPMRVTSFARTWWGPTGRVGLMMPGGGATELSGTSGRECPAESCPTSAAGSSPGWSRRKKKRP